MKSISMTPALRDYMLAHSTFNHPVLAKLKQHTATMAEAVMQIAPEQGAFMATMAQLCQVKRALEVGVFTGYSSLAVALAMPDDGRIVALDVSDEYTRVARRFWKEAGVDHKIDLRLGKAVDTLNDLRKSGHDGTFDMAFIDADKTGYDAYYEACLKLLKPQGLLLIDNVLWDGNIINEQDQSDSVRAIRALNDKVAADKRVASCILPVADGITMVCRR